MIYTISEWLATISESLIIFLFLIKTLNYKEISKSKKIIGTISFCVLQCTVSLLLDYFFKFEEVRNIKSTIKEILKGKQQ